MNPVSSLITEIENADLWDKTIQLARNDYLTSAGKLDTNLYYIVEGSMLIYMMDDDMETVIRFGYKNNLIAALDSFISEKPSDFYIKAIKKTTVKVISKTKFMQLINLNKDISQLWIEILSGLIYQQLERERDILINSPKDRYQRVLRRSPQLFQEIPHKYIASYLRMAPETLSRLKKS